MLVSKILNFYFSNQAVLKLDYNGYKALLLPYEKALKFLHQDFINDLNGLSFDLLLRGECSFSYKYLSSLGFDFNLPNNANIEQKLLYAGDCISKNKNLLKNDVCVEFIFNFNENDLSEYRMVIDSIPEDTSLNILDELLVKNFLDINPSKTWVYARVCKNETYIVEFVRFDELKVKLCKTTYIDKSIGAKLNGEIEVGFFIHIEEGYLRKIEGYTFGEDWPEKIETIEFFEIDKM